LEQLEGKVGVGPRKQPEKSEWEASLPVAVVGGRWSVVGTEKWFGGAEVQTPECECECEWEVLGWTGVPCVGKLTFSLMMCLSSLGRLGADAAQN
jgi:hypothetical protein